LALAAASADLVRPAISARPFSAREMQNEGVDVWAEFGDEATAHAPRS